MVEPGSILRGVIEEATLIRQTLSWSPGCRYFCSGTLNMGTYALNSNKGTRECVGRLLLMRANSREDVDVARTGDIVAVAGLKNVITGKTLCDEKNHIILERMDVMSPSPPPLLPPTHPVASRAPSGGAKSQDVTAVDVLTS